MSAPGLELELMEAMELKADTNRTAINFMGCYAAVHALKMAADIVAANEGAMVLVVCTELCSLHFQNSFAIENIISNAIFADGAAAVLIQGQTKSSKYLTIDSFYCDLLPQTNEEMAWYIADFGFDIVLSAYVPQAIKTGIAAFTEKLFQQSNSTLKDIDFFAIHPGGIKILQACEESLNISKEDNQYSYQTLKNFGNMSSATVLSLKKYGRFSLLPIIIKLYLVVLLDRA